MRLRAVVGGVGLVVVALVLLATPAGAQAGGCTATANGGDVRSYRTPDRALTVSKDGGVSIVASAPGPGAYKVDLQFSGLAGRWTAKTGTYDDNGWSSEVAVAEYAKHGVGIYKVIASSINSGGTCGVVAYVKVTGASPISSTAGKVAAASAAAGLAATGVAVGRAGRDLSERAVGGGVMDWIGGSESDVLDKPKTPEMSTDEATGRIERFVKEGEDPILIWAMCSSAAIAAIGLTIRAMAAEGVQSVVAMIGRRFR